MRTIAPLVGALVSAALIASPALAARDDLRLVSRGPGVDGKGANAGSYGIAVSDDGRFIAFGSEASNLHPDDTDHASDVYLRDMKTNSVALLDRATGAHGVVANAQAYAPSMSADGRYVTFYSCATNLDPTDTHKKTCDVYVRDRKASTTSLVSRANGAAGVTGDGDSLDSSISAEGRYVVFSSEAKNLAAGDKDDVLDVFVRDLKTNRTILVTGSKYDVRKGEGGIETPVISGDGRVVAFVTARPDLVKSKDPATGGTDSVLVRDLDSGKLDVVSRASGPAGALADEASSDPVLSDNGRFVAFDTLGTNIAPANDPVHSYGQVFVRDRKTDTTVPVTVYAKQDEDSLDLAEAQAISGDGRFVVFNSDAPALHPGVPEFDENTDVFLRDMKSGTVTLVSRAAGPVGAPADIGADFATATRDGRFVVFMSLSGNLDPDAVAAKEDPNADIDEDTAGPDIYRRDVLGPYGASSGPGDRGGCPPGRTPIAGTAQADVRRGTAAAETISGRLGDDVLRGGGGRDCVYGDAGRDRLDGGSGPDRLFGGSGADRVDGGTGRDIVIGGAGNDRLRGQGGADRLADHSGRDRFAGGAGNDRIDARDRRRRERQRPDTVSCGAGLRDVARVDVSDHVAGDCERVIRR